MEKDIKVDDNGMISINPKVIMERELSTCRLQLKIIVIITWLISVGCLVFAVHTHKIANESRRKINNQWAEELVKRNAMVKSGKGYRWK